MRDFPRRRTPFRHASSTLLGALTTALAGLALVVGIGLPGDGAAKGGSGLPDDVEVTHLNLNDGTVEGIRHKELSAWSVQYHPEASPGPHDAIGLFHRFREQLGG